jgi:hypothetical protein
LPECLDAVHEFSIIAVTKSLTTVANGMLAKAPINSTLAQFFVDRLESCASVGVRSPSRAVIGHFVSLGLPLVEGTCVTATFGEPRSDDLPDTATSPRPEQRAMWEAIPLLDPQFTRSKHQIWQVGQFVLHGMKLELPELAVIVDMMPNNIELPVLFA